MANDGKNLLMALAETPKPLSPTKGDQLLHWNHHAISFFHHQDKQNIFYEKLRITEILTSLEGTATLFLSQKQRFDQKHYMRAFFPHPGFRAIIKKMVPTAKKWNSPIDPDISAEIFHTFLHPNPVRWHF